MRAARLVGWVSRFAPGRGPTLEAIRRRFVALDLETTGLDPRLDAVVSLAVIPFVEGERSEGLVTLVDPGRPIPAESVAIHGLTSEIVRGAPTIDRVLPDVETALAGDVVVGHGVGFDLAFLARERRARRMPPLSNPALDTQRLAAGLHPRWRDFSLEHVAARLGVRVVARHTAEGDALTAARILLALAPELAAHGLRTLSDLRWLQRQAPLA